MIGAAAPVFGAGAMLRRLGVAQVLLLLPLGPTVLKPYLHLYTEQYSVTQLYLIRTVHIGLYSISTTKVIKYIKKLTNTVLSIITIINKK